MKTTQTVRLIYLALCLILIATTLISCQQGTQPEVIAQQIDEAEIAASPTPDATGTPEIQVSATSIPTPQTMPPTPTTLPTYEPTATIYPNLLLKAQAIKIDDTNYNFTVFEDGRVLVNNRDEYFVSPAEIDYLHTTLLVYSSSLWSAYEAEQIHDTDCEQCARVFVYHPAHKQLNKVVIGADVQPTSQADADNSHEIQTSATYTYNLLKRFLERTMLLASYSDNVITAVFYQNGALNEQLSFTAQPDGTVLFSSGEAQKVTTNAIIALERTLNNYIFEETKSQSDAFTKRTTNCINCFQLTFFDYGQNKPITIQGNTNQNAASQLESLVIYELDFFARQILN